MRTEALGIVLPDGRQLRWTVIHDDLSNARFAFSAGREGKAEHVEFRRVTFTNVDFSGLSFHGFMPAGSTFVGCNFSRATFESVHLGLAQVQRDLRTPIKPNAPRYPQTTFRNCEFSETKFNEDNFYIGNVRFDRCRFENARLNRMGSSTGEFVDCVFVGKLIQVGFAARPSREAAARIGRAFNEFRGNDYRETQMYDCSFSGGIDLDAQLLPSGPEYVRLSRVRERVGKVGLQVEAWPNIAESVKGLDALDTLLYYPTRGQNDIFMRRAELGAGLEVPSAIRERVWELLMTVQLEDVSDEVERPLGEKSGRRSQIKRLFRGSPRQPQEEVFPLGLPASSEDDKTAQ